MDLITEEPVKTGSFLLLGVLKIPRPLRLGRRDEPKRKRARFILDHAVNDDLFQRQVRVRPAADFDHLFEGLERDRLFGVVWRIRSDKHGLADGIGRLLHRGPYAGMRELFRQTANHATGFYANSPLRGLSRKTKLGFMQLRFLGRI